MEDYLQPAYEEACWPIMLMWERINHAYTSNSPPTDWGLQKGDYGFQTWFFHSHNEKYTVVWDNRRSYWKVNTPFNTVLYFVGPLFIDKSRTGLHVPPLLTVYESDKDILMPAAFEKVSTKMLQIVKYVVKPYSDEVKILEQKTSN